MKDIKAVLAEKVQKFIVEDLELLLDTEDGTDGWEALRVSRLETIVKVKNPKRGPRYFRVRVSEQY